MVERGVRSELAGPNSLKYLRKRGFAKSADRQAGESDAKLHARYHAVQITEERFDDPRAGASLGDQLPHA